MAGGHYTEPTTTWYIVPAHIYGAKTIDLRLTNDAKASQWRERWDFLGDDTAIEIP